MAPFRLDGKGAEHQDPHWKAPEPALQARELMLVVIGADPTRILARPSNLRSRQRLR